MRPSLRKRSSVSRRVSAYRIASAVLDFPETLPSSFSQSSKRLATVVEDYTYPPSYSQPVALNAAFTYTVARSRQSALGPAAVSIAPSLRPEWPVERYSPLLESNSSSCSNCGGAQCWHWRFGKTCRAD